MLIILAAVFLFFRLIDIDRTLSQDEILPKCTFLSLEFPGNFLGDYGQPPLWQLPNSILASMLGTSNWVFRIIPVAASMATTILLMLYLRKRFGAEYAILGLMLLAFFPWQINTSNQALQSSLLTLFMISSVFFAERFLEKRKRFHLLAATALSAMAMLTMFIAVIAPLAICLYIIFSQSRSITESFRDALIYCGVTAGLFAAVMAVVHYIYPLAITSSIAHTQDLGGFQNSCSGPSLTGHPLFMDWPNGSPFLIGATDQDRDQELSGRYSPSLSALISGHLPGLQFGSEQAL